ncbi:hypothetical protein QR680_016416 [Steinernema hermaphroditum]|uniref:Uncharacterized protein n=1 Tax=Steinernema hermaphroditum TaxID=289476 RepID=A0AA39HD47_9BILA|nr:hypothetical protein QR680_016416 [Steinernema hermaphroditum]
MSGQAQEVGEFYTLDELELLTEVAIKGTLNGRRVPVVVKDAAKHYRDSIIRQVIRPSVVLSSEAHEVNETLLALSEEKMRTKEAFDSDVFESKSENDNGDGTTEEMVPEFDQDEDSDIEILSVHGVDVGPIHPVLNLAEDNKDIKEDNKDVKEDNKFGLNLETPTMQTLSSILTQSLNSPLPLCRSTRISGIWQNVFLAAMSEHAQEVDDFYTIDELELLTEVATKGTLDGRRVPAVVKDATKHYRDSIMRQVSASAGQLCSQMRDVNETLRALSDEGLREGETFDNEVVEISSDEDDDVEMQTADGGTRENNNFFGSNAEMPATQTLSTSINQPLDSSLSPNNSTNSADPPRLSGIWKCQLCNKEGLVTSKLGLIRHVGSHAPYPIRCNVKGCRTVRGSPDDIVKHLREAHGLTTKKLTRQQDQYLRTSIRAFYKKSEESLDIYFPPAAYMGTYKMKLRSAGRRSL